MQYSEALEQQIAISRRLDDDNQWKRIEKLATTEDLAGLRSAGSLCTTFGESYFVDGPPGQLLVSAVQELPDNAILQRDMVRSGAGFVWLAAPLPLPRGDDLLAWGWSFYATDDFPDRHRERLHGTPITRIGPDEAAGITLAFFLKGWNLLPWPLTAVRWEFGASMRDSIQDSPPEPRLHTKLNYAIALFLLMEQRLLAVQRSRPDRAARKRVAEWRPEPIVNVITLRRRQTVHRESDGAEATDWACQWLVRGHWRQQWYPSLNLHQPKWIAPYIKGPEDKPLKEPRATVYAVIR